MDIAAPKPPTRCIHHWILKGGGLAADAVCKDCQAKCHFDGGYQDLAYVPTAEMPPAYWQSKLGREGI